MKQLDFITLAKSWGVWILLLILVVTFILGKINWFAALLIIVIYFLIKLVPIIDEPVWFFKSKDE